MIVTYKDIKNTHSTAPTTNPFLLVVTEGPIRCMIAHQGTVKEAPTL